MQNQVFDTGGIFIVEIRWFGTATLTFSSRGHSIIFDPFFSFNKELPRPTIEELAQCGDIFITHGHFDHLINVPQILKASEATVYCTETAAASLVREGVDQSRIKVIKPGDCLDNGLFKLKVYRGEHIKFDLPLIIKTLFSRRAITNFKDLRRLVSLAKLYPQDEVLVFLIEAGDKTVLHMGSLNLAANVEYPTEVDLLTLPFQGRSDLDTYTPKFIERLKPAALLLHHTCDSFPPVSSPVRTEDFTRAMELRYPGLKVIRPFYGQPVTF
jgi:L-ascorbate metabolism protein UlaG (beta-lactamase superfamily)